MKKELDKIIKSAITAFLAIATTSTVLAAPSDVMKNNTEKCYGIVKAGQNDCATAKQSCAGSSTKDKQSDAFIFLPKGLCKKIAGGTLNLKEDGKT